MTDLRLLNHDDSSSLDDRQPLRNAVPDQPPLRTIKNDHSGCQCADLEPDSVTTKDGSESDGRSDCFNFSQQTDSQTVPNESPE
jgi:hypothetical protein